jgi:hypothetical protein
MKRVIVYGGILSVAAVVTATLVFPNLASTQTLPSPSSVRTVETTYASVGVATFGSTGSVAWFIETNTDKERHPIACVAVSGNIECKRGTFPQR